MVQGRKASSVQCSRVVGIKGSNRRTLTEARCELAVDGFSAIGGGPLAGDGGWVFRAENAIEAAATRPATPAASLSDACVGNIKNKRFRMNQDQDR